MGDLHDTAVATTLRVRSFSPFLGPSSSHIKPMMRMTFPGDSSIFVSGISIKLSLDRLTGQERRSFTTNGRRRSSTRMIRTRGRDKDCFFDRRTDSNATEKLETLGRYFPARTTNDLHRSYTLFGALRSFCPGCLHGQLNG